MKDPAPLRPHAAFLRRWSKSLAVAISVLFAASGLVGLTVAPAQAASPQISVSPSQGLNPKGGTLKVKGRDYLIPPAKEGGGVYAVFGIVHNKKYPSKGGTAGRDYIYPGKASATTRGGTGIRFIAFSKDGSTSAAANAIMTKGGNWSVTIDYPGSTFKYEDHNGKTQTADCMVDQCGVYTFGAHGERSPSNEKFTPVKFKQEAKPTPKPTKKPTKKATPKPTKKATPKPTKQPTSAPATPTASATPSASASATPSPSASASKKATKKKDKKKKDKKKKESATATPSPMAEVSVIAVPDQDEPSSAPSAEATTVAQEPASSSTNIGIVIGVVIALAVAGALGLFISRRRRA